MTSKAPSRQSRFTRKTALGGLKQLAIVAAVYFIYMFVRKFLIPDIEAVAFANATRIASFEFAGGFLWEPHWQEWAIQTSRALVIFFNYAYVITFWPIIITVGAVLYFLDRDRYFHYRNVILLSFVLALIVFAIFPLAPPRYLPEYGFVDSIQRFGPTGYGGRDMAVFYNAFAAMPSLHFGWTVLFGVMFIRMKYVWLKPFGVLYPAMTFFAITISGNHYIFDAVGGAAVIAASFLIYETSSRFKVGESISKRIPEIQTARAAAYLGGAVLRSKAHFASGLAHLKSQVASGLANLKSRTRPAYAPNSRRAKGFSVLSFAARAKRT